MRVNIIRIPFLSLLFFALFLFFNLDHFLWTPFPACDNQGKYNSETCEQKSQTDAAMIIILAFILSDGYRPFLFSLL